MPANPLAPASAPLTAAQKQLWILAQLGTEESSSYNEFVAIRLVGPLHIPSLRHALQKVADRHEALRTTFSAQGDLQLIHNDFVVDLSILDFTQERESAAAAVEAWLSAEGERPFDLNQGPLFTAHLLRLNSREHVLALKAHHIIVDGWSWGVIAEEASLFYTARYTGTAISLPAALQFREYAARQDSQRYTQEMKRHGDYWLHQLAGPIHTLQLPTDRPRSAKRSYQGARQTLHLSAQLVTSLRKLSRERACTLFMTLVAAYTALLHRLTGQTDLITGIPVTGRFDEDSGSLVGYATHLLPIRSQIDPKETFSDHLSKTRKLMLDGYEHEVYPFAWLLEELRERRADNRSSLISGTFNLDRSVNLPNFGSATSRPYSLPRRAVAFDLVVNAIEFNQEIVVDCDFNTALFDAETIQRWLGHFRTLLEGILADPARRLADLPLLTEAERRQLLSRWDMTAVEYRAGQSLHHLFEAQAERNPESIALVFEDETVTYRELNTRANQLAHYLRSTGFRQGALAGLCMERSVGMIVGLLGILKAGGAYVPLDPTYPPARLDFMLGDAQPTVVVTQEKFAREVLSTGTASPAKTVRLDGDVDAISQQPVTNPPRIAAPDAPAYVIYTSGSTGLPKGTVVSHYNVTRLFAATAGWFHFDEHDVWTLFHSVSFDFSVWEVWGALLHGGRLVIVPHAVSRSPEEFHALLRKERVTVLNQTPSAFRQLLQVDESSDGGGPTSLRFVIFGGEALDIRSLSPWFTRHGATNPQLVNMYGITETTVHVTYRPLTEADLAQSASLIGRPIPDLWFYILDQSQQPVPLGIPGEIYVGGAGVAQGYLNRPELTRERFISNPLGPGRLYRTGDLARYRADGDIEYLGRIDAQVKIRGFRVEPGEIEATLNQYPGIRDSIILVNRVQEGDMRLFAYIVSDQGVNPDDLRNFLRVKLPDYMVPANFIEVEKFPLTSNGKVDRQALQELSSQVQLAEETPAPPRTRVEIALVEIWSEVLARPGVGIHSDFFDLGGHSLLVTQVVSRINAVFSIELPMRTLFDVPTVGTLAERIEAILEARKLQSGPNQTPDRPSVRREEILI